jgi:hypothetical protein
MIYCSRGDAINVAVGRPASYRGRGHGTDIKCQRVIKPGMSYVLDKMQKSWYKLNRNCSQPDQPKGLRLGYFRGLNAR